MRYKGRDRDVIFALKSKGGSGGGTDTSDATATVDDILSGKTAYVNGGKVTGNIASFDGDYECSSDSTAPSGWDVVDGIIDGSITEVVSNATSVRKYAFYEYNGLTTASFPQATSGGDYAFYNCRKLTTANFPQATTIGTRMFYDCKKLTTANFPQATIMGERAFGGCEELTTVNLPKVTSIWMYAFYGCSSLKAVILRSETLCTLESTNAFSNCYHIFGTVNSYYNPNGDKDGYIYVPRSLYDQYIVATNWATYASQIRILEDYTVDGTIAGALDESKI